MQERNHIAASARPQSRHWLALGAQLGLAASLAIGLGACASSKAGDVYSRGEAQHAMSYRDATVISVRSVRMEGTRTPAGTLAGGVVGGVAGSTVGDGKGAAIAAVLGAVVGGIAGSAAEEGYTRADAWELALQYDNGERVVVVQEQGNDRFSPGERVKVLSGSKTRVTK